MRKHVQLGANLGKKAVVGLTHARGAWSNVEDLAQHFGERHQTLERLRVVRAEPERPIGEAVDPPTHAFRKSLSAARTGAAGGTRLVGGEDDTAFAVTIEVVFALLGEELDRTEEALAFA